MDMVKFKTAGATNCVKTMDLRLQIAYKIQNIKSRISEIKDTSENDKAFRLRSSADKASTSFNFSRSLSNAWKLNCLHFE